MRVERWLEESLILRVVVLLSFTLLAFIPLAHLLIRFFHVPLSVTLLILASLLGVIVWLQQPRRMLGRTLLAEAIATLPEAGVMRDAIEEDVARLLKHEPVDIIPGGLVLILTILIMTGWIASILTIGMTWQDMLVRLGIHIPDDAQIPLHAKRMFDIPVKARAAITGSEGSADIKSSPLLTQIPPEVLALSQREDLIIPTGGLTAGGGIRMPTYQNGAVSQMEGRVQAVSAVQPEAEDLIITYYQLLSQD